MPFFIFLMAKLIILPLITEFEKIDELAAEIMAAFRERYSGYEIIDDACDLMSGDVFAPDVVLGTYTLINGVPGQGIHRNFGQYLGGNHGLVITDRIINYGGYAAGGTADKENGTALVTTKDISLEDSLFRLLGVALHEMGHLYGLIHHDAEVIAGKFCPMIDRTWDDPEFGNETAIAQFLDSRANKFCDECYKTIGE